MPVWWPVAGRHVVFINISTVIKIPEISVGSNDEQLLPGKTSHKDILKISWFFMELGSKIEIQNWSSLVGAKVSFSRSLRLPELYNFVNIVGWSRLLELSLEETKLGLKYCWRPFENRIIHYKKFICNSSNTRRRTLPGFQSPSAFWMLLKPTSTLKYFKGTSTLKSTALLS